MLLSKYLLPAAEVCSCCLFSTASARLPRRPVVSPVTIKAGALGAALQAIWCFSAEKGEAVFIQDICERYARLDSASRCEPDREHMEIYAEIFNSYLRLERQLGPLNI